MTEDTDGADRRVVTDHEWIRQLADRHDAVPMSVDRPGGGLELRVPPISDEDGRERIGWEEFFERFERRNQVVRYDPEAAARPTPATFEVVDRETHVPADTAAGTTEDPAEAETEQLATGDTGDAEPVVYEREESERSEGADVHDASTASKADVEHGPTPAAEGLVLDEIHEGPATFESWELAEEYVVFRNAGEEPIDLSGWTVQNEDGRSYRFSPDTVLEPGERITLHSKAGVDDAGHRYWDSDEPVWGSRGDTILVETDQGEPVLRESFEA